jgi:hypothetical protein
MMIDKENSRMIGAEWLELTYLVAQQAVRPVKMDDLFIGGRLLDLYQLIYNLDSEGKNVRFSASFNFRCNAMQLIHQPCTL